MWEFFRSGCPLGVGPVDSGVVLPQVPAVVELLFPGGESCVTGVGPAIEPAGSTLVSVNALHLFGRFPVGRSRDAFWQCLALLF